jgi:predicted PurR-regulated permease PerM
MSAGASAPALTRRIILVVLLGGLVVLSYAVLRLFLAPIAWAAILAYATWPIHAVLRERLRTGPALSALATTVLLTAAVVLPLLWLMVLLRGEVAGAYDAVGGYLSGGSYALPDEIARIPLLGDWLQQLMDTWVRDPVALRGQVSKWLENRSGEILDVFGDVGRNAGKFGFAILTLFFLYRDGDSLLAQARQVLDRFLGPRIEGYLDAVGGMTKAVVWGLVATALMQGLIAGIGYWWVGLEAPVLLGALTALVALIPFGAPVVWGSIGVWLLVSGALTDGIVLLVWGALAVSWVDNLIRPLVISTATRIPFLLVMFGVIGGLAAFGLIGLFLGPVILAVLVAVWREWLEETSPLLVPGAPGAPGTPLGARESDVAADKEIE